VLTVYLFVWQFISIGASWLDVELLPPIRIIEQGSFCIMAALCAWITDLIFLRYSFRELVLVGLWLFSLYDIYICLYHRGRLYVSSSTIRKSSKRKTPSVAVYYVRGVDKWKKSSVLGFADFFVYNILILLVMTQSSSIIVKICIMLGCIINVHVGQLLTHWLQCRCKIESAPGLPLPVIMVSLYVFFLDSIMPNFDQCVKL